MKFLAIKLRCGLSLFVGMLFFTSCSSFTYESQSWHIAQIDDSSSDVIVRYTGIGATTKDIKKRSEKAGEIIEYAFDKNPEDPITSKLRDARRKVYVQDGKIVMEESGTIRNPLSWFEQTGFNVLTWCYDPIDLSLSGKYVVKSGWNESDILLATNGRVIDESFFSTSRLRIDTPLAIGGDTLWRRDEPIGVTDLSVPDKRQAIIWPRASRMFYWKFSGPAFNKSWQSLTPEFTALLKSITTKPKSEDTNKEIQADKNIKTTTKSAD